MPYEGRKGQDGGREGRAREERARMEEERAVLGKRGTRPHSLLPVAGA